MENKKETLTAAEEQKRQQQFIEKARIYVREKSEELGRPLYACTTTFAVWLYDAGSTCGGKTEKELPVCGSDLRNP